MSLEQLDSSLGTIGPQVDVFGWGAVLHALLTGEAPRAVRGLSELMGLYRSRYPADLLQSHHESDIERLCSVCALCLNPDPAARPATMLDVLALLEQTREEV